MLEWKRTKYLAKGNYICEEVSIGDQRIEINYIIREGKPAHRAFYYKKHQRIIGFPIVGSSIEEVREEAYRKVRNYINDQIADWSGALYSWWEQENWNDNEVV